MIKSPCDKHEVEEIGSASDYTTGEDFDLFFCHTCQYGRTRVGRDDVISGKYYPQTYHRDGRRYGSTLNWFSNLLLRRRLGRLDFLKLEPGRALDYGCGEGQLANQLQEQGWEVVCTEMSERAALRARSLGLTVLLEGANEQLAVSKPFDLAIVWHVLEHVWDPEELLDLLSEVLKPGGILLIGVPDYSSLEGRLGGRHWFHLDVPRHVCHFPRATLRKNLEERGFEILTSLNFAPEYDFFSFIQTVLNRIGLPANELYKAIRHHKDPEVGRHMTATILISFVLAPFLFVLSKLWLPIACLTDNSATVAFIARRVRPGS